MKTPLGTAIQLCTPLLFGVISKRPKELACSLFFPGVASGLLRNIRAIFLINIYSSKKSPFVNKNKKYNLIMRREIAVVTLEKVSPEQK